MTCDHTQWVYPPPAPDWYTGEITEQEPYSRGTYEDIDTGRFRCTQCGEVGYYTGKWKEHWEGGRKLLDERTGHVKGAGHD